MADPEPKAQPSIAFEKFVSAIARVPKSEADEAERVESNGGETADSAVLEEVGEDDKLRFGVTIDKFAVEHVADPEK